MADFEQFLQVIELPVDISAYLVVNGVRRRYGDGSLHL